MTVIGNILAPWKATPASFLNRTLWLSVFTFGMAGGLVGLDFGSISGVMVQKSFLHRFDLQSDTHSPEYIAGIKGTIGSLSSIGSIAGSFCTFVALERLGRRHTLQIACIIYVVGLVIQVTAMGQVVQMYIGRILVGLGGGMGAVTGPTYIAEVAPKEIRGAIGILYVIAADSGTVFGCFLNYGTALHVSDSSDAQWQLPLAIGLAWPLAMLFSSIWTPESPRWLLKKGRQQDALIVFGRLRGRPTDDEYVAKEVAGVYAQLEREAAEAPGSSFWGPMRELFTVPSSRYRLGCAFMVGCGSQWAGGPAFTAFAPALFALVGIDGSHSLLFTALYATARLAAPVFVGLFVIDRLGRKTALSAGIIMQVCAALYLAVFLQATYKIPPGQMNQIQRGAEVGGVAMIFVSGLAWATGWNAVQQPLNPELFPLRLRAVGVSLAVCFRSLMGFASVKALPNMIVGIKGHGTFYFFVGQGVVWVLLVWFFLPETKGRALEDLDSMFELPWYKIGRSGGKVASGDVEDVLVVQSSESVAKSEGSQ